MNEPFTLEIITPHQPVFKKEVLYVRVPGVTGEMGIYANHTPLLAILAEGNVIYEDAAEIESDPVLIQGGFLEVLTDKVTILNSPTTLNHDETNDLSN